MNHRAKKHFGQNFLTDKNLLQKIVEGANIENKNVIEIGPGKGALTNFLVSKANKVVAFEVDKDLKPFLDSITKDNNNFEYHFIDILETDFNINEEFHVVSNIPYNITSPIIFKILNEPLIMSATLMVQKEVSDRITSNANSKNYNALSVIVQYYMDVFKVMNVNRKMFNPVPKVDSAVFKMIRKEKVLNKQDEELFINIVKSSFHQKRKTITNNLSFSFNIAKNEINDFLIKNNINPLARAETISLEQFITITKNWIFN